MPSHFFKCCFFATTRKIKCMKHQKNAKIPLCWINKIRCNNHNSFIYSIFLKLRASRNDIISHKKSFQNFLNVPDWRPMLLSKIEVSQQLCTIQNQKCHSKGSLKWRKIDFLYRICLQSSSQVLNLTQM